MPLSAHVLKKTFFHVAVSQRTAAKLYKNVKITRRACVACFVAMLPSLLFKCPNINERIACGQKLIGAAVGIEDRCGTLRRETLAGEGPGYAPRQVFEGLVAGFKRKYSLALLRSCHLLSETTKFLGSLCKRYCWFKERALKDRDTTVNARDS